VRFVCYLERAPNEGRPLVPEVWNLGMSNEDSIRMDQTVAENGLDSALIWVFRKKARARNRS
jgi:hypothetical protein